MYLRQVTHTYIIRKEDTVSMIPEYRFPLKRKCGFLHIGTPVSNLRNWGVKPPGILIVYRADEGLGTGLILNDIISAIKNSALVIADITPDNPNVFYEVGFAHALNKPTILLNEKKQREKLPFDISGFRTIFYDNSIGGKKMVEEKLDQFIANINLNIPSGGGLSSNN